MQDRKVFFFEKKNRKTFGNFAYRVGQRLHQGIKVFCFFFSKKKSFFPLMFILAWYGASAADVQVTVTHVRNAKGHVLVALCARADFLKPHCPWQANTQAAAGTVRLTIHAVPPGRYAIEAFHDENDNQKIDRGFFGIPTEGMGFSNDAPMHFGPPDFDTAAIDVRHADVSAAMSMRYY